MYVINKMLTQFCFFSGNDKPTFNELSLNVIHQYAAHWETLGALLGLKDYDIANISRNYPNDAVRACRELMMMWLQNIPSPTWAKLEDAIKSLKRISISNQRGKIKSATVINPTLDKIAVVL